MHVELTNVALVGVGARADLQKMSAQGMSAENIKMNISTSLLFPRPGHVECMVTLESESSSDAVRLKATYQGSFTLSTDRELVDEDQRAISAACTAKIFPYLREFIADVTRRLPLTSPLVLSPALGDEKALIEQIVVRPNEQPEPDGEKVQ